MTNAVLCAADLLSTAAKRSFSDGPKVTFDVSILHDVERWRWSSWALPRCGPVLGPQRDSWRRLVQLSEPARLARVVKSALHRDARCSSDRICATRTPAIRRSSCRAQAGTAAPWRRRPAVI